MTDLGWHRLLHDPCAHDQATERFAARRIPGPKPYYSTNERCAVWFEPTEVRGSWTSLQVALTALAGRDGGVSELGMLGSCSIS